MTCPCSFQFKATVFGRSNTAKSGIPGDIPAKSLYSGYPAIENRQWLKNTAALNRLPDLQRRVWELESEIEKLKKR